MSITVLIAALERKQAGLRATFARRFARLDRQRNHALFRGLFKPGAAPVNADGR